MRYLGLAFSLVLLSSCASVAKVQPLPAGSSVAVVSSLDDVINYEYIGSTPYMDASFHYTDTQINPDASFIAPMEASLARSGYRVVVAHVPANSPITNIHEVSHSLTAHQFSYLQKALHGQRVDRVIILAKSPVNDVNFPKERLTGYGYLQREGWIYRGTQVYGAIAVRVVNMHDRSEFRTQLAYIGEQVDNKMFATSKLEVQPWSVAYFNNWMQTRFAPNILSSLQQMKILRN